MHSKKRKIAVTKGFRKLGKSERNQVKHTCLYQLELIVVAKKVKVRIKWFIKSRNYPKKGLGGGLLWK